MGRRLSPQSSGVLDALADDPITWRYGYELGQQVGLRAGTLYPIQMRLSEGGLLEDSWESDPPAGRPPRHLYRLMVLGQQAAAELGAASSDAATHSVRGIQGLATRSAS